MGSTIGAALSAFRGDWAEAARSTPQARVLAFSYTYSVVGRIPAAVLQVRDASRNGAPVCVDAFTVLR